MKKHTNSIDVACGDGGYLFGLDWRGADLTNTAVKQLSSAKRARVTATNALTSEAETGFSGLQDGLASASKNIQMISVQISKEVRRFFKHSSSADWEQTAALSSATHAYHSAAAAQISTLRQVTEHLVEAGTREDKSTGNTPRKKTWQYQDEWELTKGRDVVLKEWRKRRVSVKNNENFYVDHLPLPDDDGEEVVISDDDAVMMEAEEVEEEVLAQSVTSSLSSSSTAASVTIRQKYLLPPPIPPPPVPAPVLKPAHKRGNSVSDKSGLPTLGTLTERPTNIFGGRRRLR